MHLLELTLDTPEENLALDEALLEAAEAESNPPEVLRMWESPRPMVVIGRGSRVATEVNLDFCRGQSIPVLRRTSGGAAIVAAPGCLMYALVLNYDRRPHLRSLDAAHQFVLETTLTALHRIAPTAARQGTSDLTSGPWKFSGNSMRAKRRNFLYHGTLLYDLHLPLVELCLRMPPRQPDYREGRPHTAFVANLPASAGQLRQALCDAWDARPTDFDWPEARVQQLVETKYGRQEWNEQL